MRSLSRIRQVGIIWGDRLELDKGARIRDSTFLLRRSIASVGNQPQDRHTSAIFADYTKQVGLRENAIQHVI